LLLLNASASIADYLEKNAESLQGQFLIGSFSQKAILKSLKYACMNWSGEHLTAWQNLDFSIKTGNSSFEEIYKKPFFDFLNDNPEKLTRLPQRQCINTQKMITKHCLM
jgi:C-methyltransferase